MMKYILIAIICFMAIMIFYTVIEIRSGKKKSEAYVSMFNLAYANKGVVDSLKDILSNYKPNSIEYLTINKAIYYLEHSIMRDYDTAFGYIEQTFGGKEVLALHEEVINKERRNIMLLLTKEGGV